jgi:hypothetical protein
VLEDCPATATTLITFVGGLPRELDCREPVPHPVEAVQPSTQRDHREGAEVRVALAPELDERRPENAALVIESSRPKHARREPAVWLGNALGRGCVPLPFLR